MITEIIMPINTEIIPNNAAKKAIFSGDLAICLAVAAGIISIEEISNIPNILIDEATIRVIINIRIISNIEVFMPFTFAISLSIVINSYLGQFKYKMIKIMIEVLKIHNISCVETVRISPKR